MRYVGGSTNKPKVLLVDDIPEQRNFIKACIGDDFEVNSAQSDTEALRLSRGHEFDLIMLDVDSDDLSIDELYTEFRTRGINIETPIIFLASKEALNDQLASHSLKADHLIIKPFQPNALRARLKAHLQLRQDDRRTREVLRAANLEIDTGAFKAYCLAKDDKSELRLTTRELRLLSLFCQNIDTILSRTQVLDAVWGKETNVTNRTVDTHVCQLRKKIKGTGVAIESVYGCGYRTKLNV